jgi:hypothetical protein
MERILMRRTSFRWRFWIPACAGMTIIKAGMMIRAGMTIISSNYVSRGYTED